MTHKELQQWADEAVAVLSLVKGEVGMIKGEQIEELLARAKGERFSAAQYNYERLPGEQ